ncbi:hypothetical protein BG011_002764 [Mortierella polycephala]|uniref:NodB homology domain-containing protein n=1 Tax=Mortierella polycephala TaxID=41804 RepID=A0A9P6Q5T2_9FUNG|nr:hypothetical protein BG011_002764 [Mortierella polycephala]
MKVNAILSLSALFMASVATAVMPDDPNKIDTCIMPGVVALTFDDGPGMYNDQLLALLAKKNVKATFFLLGSMIAENAGQAASLKKILAGGHQLASHTYSHSNMDNMTADKMKKEIQDTSDIMFANSGVRPAYMRAPEGRCAELCTKTMNELGQIISHWNVDTNDWRFAADKPDVAVKNSMVEITDVILNGSDPATDSFILLEHEIHQFSVDLLAEIVIDKITAKGYRFVTMEECVGKPAYLAGSTVPTTTAATSVPTGGNTSAAPGVTGVPTTGGVAPTGSSSAAPGETTAPGTADKDTDNAAGFVKAGAWAMGLAAALGYALI